MKKRKKSKKQISNYNNNFVQQYGNQKIIKLYFKEIETLLEKLQTTKSTRCLDQKV